MCRTIVEIAAPNITTKLLLWGESKIFMRTEGMNKLEDELIKIMRVRHEVATKIQKAWKRR